MEWVNPPSGDPHIRAIHLGDAPLTFVAGAEVGSGALVGDYNAANVRGIACKVFIENLAEFEAVECGVSADGSAGRRIYHSRQIPASQFSENGWHRVEFSFGEEWFYQDGDEWKAVTVGPEFLASIADVGITFLPLPGSVANSLAAIDDVILEPHVTPPPLALLTSETTFQITFAPARGLQAAVEHWQPNFDWKEVAVGITGPLFFRFKTPRDAPSKIYRVKTRPLYQLITTAPR